VPTSSSKNVQFRGKKTPRDAEGIGLGLCPPCPGSACKPGKELAAQELGELPRAMLLIHYLKKKKEKKGKKIFFPVIFHFSRGERKEREELIEGSYQSSSGADAQRKSLSSSKLPRIFYLNTQAQVLSFFLSFFF